MINHTRDRKLAQQTRITQAFEDPRYRKLNSLDHQLNIRTHAPLRIIKPIDVLGAVCSQIYQKIDLHTVQKQERELVAYHSEAARGVTPHMQKLRAQVQKLWKSAAWPLVIEPSKFPCEFS